MRWERVRGVLQCAFGCPIPQGAAAAFGRRHFVLCVDCAAKQYGLAPPPDLSAGAEPSPRRSTRRQRVRGWVDHKERSSGD